jgi:hypothetical protein
MYETTAIVPAGASIGMLVIVKQSLAGGSNILVDNIDLLFINGGGTTGATGTAFNFTFNITAGPGVVPVTPPTEMVVGALAVQ